MKLSFVIPAWNEEKLLGATIRSIQQSAKYFDFEIIVADDASDDRTREIARELGAEVVSCNNRQIGQTRNDGAKIATGNVLIFVYADNLVFREVVDETVEAVEMGYVSGGSFPRFDGKIPVLATILAKMLELLFIVLRVSAGAYFFCTRKSFEQSGGFNPKYFAAEEVHFTKSMHKYGKFKTQKNHVITSGRKFRTHSAFEILSTLVLVSIPGIRNIKKRKSLWYGSRTD
ncbi:glycosyltransferase [PVC group bacterium]|nr:glycosyltransferase [PVC group bacterium]